MELTNFEIVLNIDFPDPTVIKGPDNKYYAYATQRLTSSGNYNIQVARSDNLKDWLFIGDALPEKPSWASTTQDFWAPFVLYDQGRYYLYFSALPDSRVGMGIGVAVSESPIGPFIDVGTPLVAGVGFVNIDPHAFLDPKTNKKLLYWGSGFESIKVRELNDDWTSFKDNSDVINVLDTGNAPFEKLLEGAFVIYREEEDSYFMFTSGDNCFGSYAVMIAKSKSAFGPFTKLAEEFDREDSVLLKGNENLVDPGNNSLILDEQGQWWLYCHVVEQDRKRPMARCRVHFREDGWPHIEGWSTHHLSKRKGGVFQAV